MRNCGRRSSTSKNPACRTIGAYPTAAAAWNHSASDLATHIESLNCWPAGQTRCCGLAGCNSQCGVLSDCGATIKLRLERQSGRRLAKISPRASCDEACEVVLPIPEPGPLSVRLPDRTRFALMRAAHWYPHDNENAAKRDSLAAKQPCAGGMQCVVPWPAVVPHYEPRSRYRVARSTDCKDVSQTAPSPPRASLCWRFGRD